MKSLYFIAIVPPHEIHSEVTKFKDEAALLFHSSRALNSPAHITILPPFQMTNVRIPLLEATLRRFYFDAFHITLSGFDCFKPRVIYVRVQDNKNLEKLHSNLRAQLSRIEEIKNETRPFHPHMTIAFKDLKRSIFPEAWDYFKRKEYDRSFLVDTLYLMKFSDRKWRIISGFKKQ